MRRYGLIGKTLSHSFSKQFFEAKFEREGIEAEYLNFELKDIADIQKVLDTHPSGLNVTIPYKESVIPFLDELTDEARKIGAVNTVLFREGKIIGANTDAFGFHQSIKPFLLNTHEKALILGNGGASKAVAFVLKQIGLDVIVAARNPKAGQFHWDDINEHMIRFCGIVVNTTPLGTWPNAAEKPELPYHAFTAEHLAVDLVYNPSRTAFMEAASAYGAVVMNGETMLREQALRAWKLWNE
jgi:shikimate dehydrogenase